MLVRLFCRRKLGLVGGLRGIGLEVLKTENGDGWMDVIIAGVRY